MIQLNGISDMNRLLIDDALKSELDKLNSRTEICDKSGHIVGYYTPAAEHERKLYEWAKAQFSEEELERRAQEPGGKTTVEVLKAIQNQ